MGRQLKKIKTISASEFELDLAPLLAVMVKLVPVLLISSAFVQVMTIETDLPQAVKEAIQKQEDKPTATIQIKASLSDGLQIIVQKAGAQKVESVPIKDGQFDFQTLHKTLQRVKTENPEVFKVELAPEANVAYKDVVRITDEARRSRDKGVTFPVKDEKQNKIIMTDYMFPDVVFSNVFDG
jgi:biopolymer transport protein ExbD